MRKPEAPITRPVSQSDSVLAGWAPLFGIYGASYAAVIVATSLVVALLTSGRARLAAALLVVLPFLVGGLLLRVEWTEPAGAPLQATIIQAGIPQDQKWQAAMLEPTLRYYRRETLAAADSDIVLWPEVAVPSLDDLMEAFIRQVDIDAGNAGQSIIFGILESDEEGGETHTYNSMFLVDGAKQETYRKRHLVPYGEYFPIPDFLRNAFEMKFIPQTSLSPGADVQPLLVHGDDTPLSVAICYEDAYGAEQLYALPEARLLINVSNDAWFGDSIAPQQHLQIARMRSIEVQRDTVRATSTGISAFIDYRGRIVERGAQFQPVVMTRDVQPRTGATPYVRWGNLPVLIICSLCLAGAWLRIRRVS